MSTDPPDIWHAGGWGEKRAARYLDVSETTFKALAKQERWPRKRIRGTRVVYPRALIRASLRECEGC